MTELLTFNVLLIENNRQIQFYELTGEDTHIGKIKWRDTDNILVKRQDAPNDVLVMEKNNNRYGVGLLNNHLSIELNDRRLDNIGLLYYVKHGDVLRARKQNGEEILTMVFTNYTIGVYWNTIGIDIPFNFKKMTFVPSRDHLLIKNHFNNTLLINGCMHNEAYLEIQNRNVFLMDDQIYILLGHTFCFSSNKDYSDYIKKEVQSYYTNQNDKGINQNDKRAWKRRREITDGNSLKENKQVNNVDHYRLRDTQSVKNTSHSLNESSLPRSVSNGQPIALNLEHVVFHYAKNKKKVIDDLTIAIPSNCLIALLGGSGAGKSTLIKLMIGLEKPVSGRISVGGSSGIRSMKKDIAYVPQQDIISESNKVIEVLREYAVYKIRKKSEREKRVHSVIHQLRLENVENSLVKSLSGGQKKRVNLGVALLSNPELCLLDEPNSGLDIFTDEEMLMILKDLVNNHHQTIVVITHALTNLNLYDNVMFLAKGKICYFGPPGAMIQYFETNSILGAFKEVDSRPEYFIKKFQKINGM